MINTVLMIMMIVTHIISNGTMQEMARQKMEMAAVAEMEGFR